MPAADWLRAAVPDLPIGPRGAGQMLGRGRKRKWGGEEGGPASAPPPSALFSISVSKLQQSLRQGEPDLRHLVLVANTLRRIQGQMQPASASGPQHPPGGGPRPEGSSQGPCRRPPGLPPSPAPVDQLLLSGMDASVFSSILEDLTGARGLGNSPGPPAAQPKDRLLCGPGPEPGRASQPCLGPLELLGPGGPLLEEGLDNIFEDIDTSMYDCDPWAPGKDACPNSSELGRPDLADLDYLLEVLVGAEEL